ncbi:MAG: Tad domain-containing protein [Candidatus Dormibacteria bacterium]
MLLILALMAAVIFGGVALAVDLGVQTHHRRSLQNSSDMAALAAARDVPGIGALAAAQQSAADDAVRSLKTQGIWGGGGTPANNGCGGRALGGYCFATSYTTADGSYSVNFSTPPLTPRNTSTIPPAPGPNPAPAFQTTYLTANYVEVDLSLRSANAFGNFVGQPQGTAGSHSVAYHWGPGGSYGFALYAQTLVATGNQVEEVRGDVYIGTTYAPQSLGQAALCAEFVDGTAAPGGHVVFGAPQLPGTAPLVNYGAPPGPLPPPPATSCPVGGGLIYAMAPSGSAASGAAAACPAGAGSNWDPTVSLCVANPPIQPPTFPEPAQRTGPTMQPAPCTINKSTSPGVYEVGGPGGCGSSLTVDFSSGDIKCVSLVLDAGATATLQGATQSSPQQPVAPASMTSFGDPSCPANANGEGAAANRSIVWAAPTAATILEDVASPGCCREYDLSGAVYMPSGTLRARKNAAIEITGQSIVYTWDVQSGNHPNPVVTYAPGVNPTVPEVLRLVE